MPKAPHALLVELRDVFVDHFKLVELNEFAFEVGMDTGNFESPTLAGRARELPEFLDHRGQLATLAVVGPKRRPDIDWVGILAKHGIPVANAPVTSLPPEIVPPPLPAGSVTMSDLRKLVDILRGYPSWRSPGERQSLLKICEVDQFVNADLSGAPRNVATEVLLQLNQRGSLIGGGTALGRLLTFLASDDALPTTDKDTITAIIAENALV